MAQILTNVGNEDGCCRLISEEVIHTEMQMFPAYFSQTRVSNDCSLKINKRSKTIKTAAE